MTSYRDDAGRYRCGRCDGYIADGARKCTRCANRKREAKEAANAAAAAEARNATRLTESKAAGQWRRNELAQHIADLLATKSGSQERQRYFEANPISGIFR